MNTHSQKPADKIDDSFKIIFLNNIVSNVKKTKTILIKRKERNKQ